VVQPIPSLLRSLDKPLQSWHLREPSQRKIEGAAAKLEALDLRRDFLELLASRSAV
jgi:hypothetical protein